MTLPDQKTIIEVLLLYELEFPFSWNWRAEVLYLSSLFSKNETFLCVPATTIDGVRSNVALNWHVCSYFKERLWIRSDRTQKTPKILSRHHKGPTFQSRNVKCLPIISWVWMFVADQRKRVCRIKWIKHAGARICTVSGMFARARPKSVVFRLDYDIYKHLGGMWRDLLNRDLWGDRKSYDVSENVGNFLSCFLARITWNLKSAIYKSKVPEFLGHSCPDQNFVNLWWNRHKQK